MPSVSSVSDFSVDINILVNSFASSGINYKAEMVADFPFHLLLTGKCKVIDTWIEQLITDSESNDVNLLFLKVDGKGRYIAVQSKLTWVADNFTYYTSQQHGDWMIFEFESFFMHNIPVLKTYCSSTDTTSKQKNSLLTINI